MLYFEDEAAGLELNRKMEQLKQQKLEQEQSAVAQAVYDEDDDRKRPAEPDSQDESNKRMRLDIVPGTMTRKPANRAASLPPLGTGLAKPVQKFRFVDPVKKANGNQASPGYRILLATYADPTAAAEDDPRKHD